MSHVTVLKEGACKFVRVCESECLRMRNGVNVVYFVELVFCCVLVFAFACGVLIPTSMLHACDVSSSFDTLPHRGRMCFFKLHPSCALSARLKHHHPTINQPSNDTLAIA